jgi:hypothetical protein
VKKFFYNTILKQNHQKGIMSIFVQLVSYKNFDVLDTIKDCIEKAKDKDNLHFGLFLEQDEDYPRELNHPRIKIERVPVGKYSHGYARAQAQKFYDGQEYVLQIDSGSRFLENWDEELKKTLNETGSSKPIITNCPNRYNLQTNSKEFPDCAYKPQLHQLIFDNPLTWPNPMKNIKNILKGRWIIDSFFFTKGQHCVECKYNPEIYYSELESSNTLRSFTSGYDIFHHYKPVVWRNYDARPVQWSDDREWWVKDRNSKNIFSKLLSGEEQNYKLGTTRSLRDFELFSGIDFLGKKLQKSTVMGTDPPCVYQNDEQWNKEYMKDYVMAVSWNIDEIEKCDDYDYWYFAIEDANEQVIHRQDLRVDREADILNFKVNYKKIIFKSLDNKIPAKLCIQPVSKSKGFLKKSKFNLN